MVIDPLLATRLTSVIHFTCGILYGLEKQINRNSMIILFCCNHRNYRGLQLDTPRNGLLAAPAGLFPVFQRWISP